MAPVRSAVRDPNDPHIAAEKAIATSSAADALFALCAERGFFLRAHPDKCRDSCDLLPWTHTTLEVRSIPSWSDRGAAADATDEEIVALPLLYAGTERSEQCLRLSCKDSRPFELTLAGAADGAPFLHLLRPHRGCNSGGLYLGVPGVLGCWAAPARLEVRLPGDDDTLLGEVVESNRLCAFPPAWYLEVRDVTGEVAYLLRAPLGATLCCLPNALLRAHEVAVLRPDGSDTGAAIRNLFPGWNMRGACNAVRQADNVQVTFPEGSTVDQRALLLAAAVLLEFSYFGGRLRLPLPGVALLDGGGGGGDAGKLE